MKTIYWKGDLAKATGKQETKYGAIFYEYVLLEGHRKGEFIWTMRN